MKNEDIKNIPVILSYFLKFLKDHNYSDGTIEVYKTYIFDFLKFIINFQNLNITIKEINIFNLLQIQTSDIRAYLVYLSYHKKNNSNTRLVKIRALKTFFDWLLSTDPNGEKKGNPIKNIDDIKKIQNPPKYLTLTNAQKIQNVFNNKNCRYPIRNNMIITLFLASGIRLSELAELNIEDILLEQYTLFIKNGKGGKERYAYINENCKNHLEKYLCYRKTMKVQSNALFLSERKNRISKREIQDIVSNAYNLMGLCDFDYSVHTLRHTCATLTYIYVKQDILLIKEMLGHKQISTTEIYTHIHNNQIKEAINNNPLSNFNVNSYKIKVKEGDKNGK